MLNNLPNKLIEIKLQRIIEYIKTSSNKNYCKKNDRILRSFFLNYLFCLEQVS